MFEKEIARYEELRQRYTENIADRMNPQALRQIRSEGTDEHLIAFFFQAAISRMEDELTQKQRNTRPVFFF